LVAVGLFALMVWGMVLAVDVEHHRLTWGEALGRMAPYLITAIAATALALMPWKATRERALELAALANISPAQIDKIYQSAPPSPVKKPSPAKKKKKEKKRG
jgi:hypothetical protein